MRRLLPVLLVSAALIPAGARSQPTSVAGPSVLSLDVDEGEVIRLVRPAAQIFVANPEIADIHAPQRQTVLLLGKKPGRTTVIALDDRGGEIARYAVEVRPELGVLRERLSRDYPQLDVHVDGTSTSIIVSGKVDTPDQAHGVVELIKAYVPDPAKIVDRLSVSSEVQVQLRVHVAEMSRQVVSQYGINWQTVIRYGQNAFGLLTGRQAINLPGTSSSGSSSSAVPLTGPINTITPLGNNDTLFGGLSTGTMTIDAVLDLLDQEGLATILAEPNLTAISGQTATFLAGGEIPVVTSTTLGSTNVTYKEYGIRLQFTPTVMSHDRISLSVRPEVSQLTSVGSVTLNGITIPALTSRRVDTTVELGSGDSFVIGGLLENDRNNTNDSLPGLGDIPILGKLFQSKNFQMNESELVVLVTPYIVAPTKPNELAVPSRPSRADSNFGKVISGASPEGQPPQPAQPPAGQAGFLY